MGVPQAALLQVLSPVAGTAAAKVLTDAKHNSSARGMSPGAREQWERNQKVGRGSSSTSSP